MWNRKYPNQKKFASNRNPPEVLSFFFNFVHLDAYTNPTVTLNATSVNSGEGLLVTCAATVLDTDAALVYTILKDSKTVQTGQIQTISPVKANDAGVYSCQVSLGDIVKTSSTNATLTGKYLLCSWFLLVCYLLLSLDIYSTSGSQANKKKQKQKDIPHEQIIDL